MKFHLIRSRSNESKIFMEVFSPTNFAVICYIQNWQGGKKLPLKKHFYGIKNVKVSARKKLKMIRLHNPLSVSYHNRK